MRHLKTITLLPSVLAVIAALSPVSYAAGSGLAANEAMCMDCTVSDNHYCGTPPLGLEKHCTSGSEWCKEPDQT